MGVSFLLTLLMATPICVRPMAESTSEARSSGHEKKLFFPPADAYNLPKLVDISRAQRAAKVLYLKSLNVSKSKLMGCLSAPDRVFVEAKWLLVNAEG